MPWFIDGLLWRLTLAVGGLIFEADDTTTSSEPAAFAAILFCKRYLN